MGAILRALLLPVGAFLWALLLPVVLPAQEWNGARVLELMDDARRVRQQVVRDPEFRSYSARARGYVYFFLDRQDTGERILVKTDQLALEVYWKSPDRTRQRIVGLRDRKSLPTNIRYHLDHLVVVQDEFGDRIRIGDGDEVESVLHPVAVGSGALYDFRLADSVTVTLHGRDEPIRVYEVEVRPRDFDLPAYVGSVFLDRSTRAIVRMDFTFTPASYEDPYLDDIRISLENGLWLGRHWLPYRQQLEIRREVPFLDIPAGSVIRGWFEIGDYEINPELPPDLFQGRTITFLPESARKSYPFEEGIHAHLEEEGLEPSPAIDEIRARAAALARDHYLSGLRRFRLHLPAPMISSVLRYNRAEGLYVGGGVSYGLSPSLGVEALAGYPFGRERPSFRLSLYGGNRGPGTGLAGYLNHPRDLGPVKGMSGVLNTLSALALEDDYRDLYFTSGARFLHTHSLSEDGNVEVRVRWEEHRSAEDVVSQGDDPSGFRPVLPTEEGRWASVAASAELSPSRGILSLGAEALLGRFEDRTFASLGGEAGAERQWLDRGIAIEGRLRGATLLGDAPPRQALFLLGGRQTLPGHPYRSRVGDAFWLLTAEGSREVLSPWARLRVFGAAGGTHFGGGPLPTPWPGKAAPSTLVSLGAGLELGWDVLRLDLARGVGGEGGWQLLLSVSHEFWPWL